MNARLLFPLPTPLILVEGIGFSAFPTELQFRAEIAAHQERVARMGIRLAENFLFQLPSLRRLSSLTRQVFVHRYLMLHDTPKLMELQELKAHHYEERQSIFSQLYQGYGRRFKTTPLFIHELNRIEEDIKNFELENLLKELSPTLRNGVKLELRLIEIVADYTDTRILRGKELGFTPQPFSTSRYFLEAGNPLAAKMSWWLETNHYNTHATKPIKMGGSFN